MTTPDARSQGALGFLTVLEHEQQGLIGGYLVLNQAGRPLEFHCTAPVKPSRAQQILFGATLDAYLYGEQIAQALLAKGSIEPLAVCTDVEKVLSVRDYVEWPVALVLAEQPPPPPTTSVPAEQPTWRVDAPHRAAPHLCTFEIGCNRLAVAIHRDADRQTISQRLAGHRVIDLSEPFERIREAVAEAQKGSRV